MTKEKLAYYLIRTLTFPCRWLSYRAIHLIGTFLGTLAFYLMTEYRKRALSNLALANDLQLTHKEHFRIAKKSFQNLAINCLEYPKFDIEDELHKVIKCENPEVADSIYKQGKGIIFFCGHQSNWEVLFLDGTRRMKGIAIGKPIKNKKLYNWIISIREKNGGNIISPRNAIKEGLRALRKGVFMGIVGDQGMPDSGYSFPFLGRRAWTSTAPALLAHKTNSPIIVATTRRVKGGYRIHYSDPLWPNQDEPVEQEVVRLMNSALTLLQESIKKSPGEWLWQHNRWKQQTPRNLYKPYRRDCICIILPMEKEEFLRISRHLPTLKMIYPQDFIFLMVPEKFQDAPLISADEVFIYRKEEETLVYDYRFKLIFNFTPFAKIRRHYKKLSAFEVLEEAHLKELAKPYIKGHEDNLSEIFKRALCRPGSLWHPEK